ncbi:MAG: proline--tRNA ligase, partial [Planctomycetia bacterium]|nr:proline--tRNA ligase [Planctomycetia bacterium]
ESLKKQLEDRRWRDEPLRVKIDDRDLRGGDKAWQHVKQGVPLRVEIGPRDLAAGAVSLACRDKPPKDRQTLPLEQFVAEVPDLLESIQRGLFDRAVAFREAHSARLDDQAAIPEFFAADGDQPAGFAHVHVADDPAVAAALDPLKVTVRCTPLNWSEDPGTCLFTGRPVKRRSVIARSY